MSAINSFGGGSLRVIRGSFAPNTQDSTRIRKHVALYGRNIDQTLHHIKTVSFLEVSKEFSGTPLDCVVPVARHFIIMPAPEQGIERGFGFASARSLWLAELHDDDDQLCDV